jgi:hypothetical protein
MPLPTPATVLWRASFDFDFAKYGDSESKPLPPPPPPRTPPKPFLPLAASTASAEIRRCGGGGATYTPRDGWSVKLHIECEFCVRSARRTQMNVTQAIAHPKEQHKREQK